MALINPQRLVAVGNDAAKAADHLTNRRPIVQIRHPSYGGQNEFIAGITDLYADHLGPSPQTSFL